MVEATKQKVITVAGPTCTGKSECGVWLAKEFDGEIVNADSMQVYKYFDIGSAKPPSAVKKEITHHLVDMVEPEEDFNGALFREAADRAINDIGSRKKIPIVVGGTGLYLRILLHGLFAVKGDASVRENLRLRYQREPEAMYEELAQIDPSYAAKISPNDRIRVIRAIEIYYSSGVSVSEWQERHGFREQRYDAYNIGLERERAELYDSINSRVDSMLQAGWVDEVRRLLDAGYSRNLKPFLSIGYRDILLYLDGALGYAEMVTKIKQETRHYAKRQMTWFFRDKGISWFRYPEDREKIKAEVRQFLQQN
ncbi:MAG TPA: tRNA (adenosine(37)-N6)-dimethylallyltransferase MiaA [Syntrophorhabdales bacterium]|nr:tRNA (adenosine(37)-N6)-dimethylallyltransferase MiaA [Syntrophorhabdales bacterium]